VLRVARTIADLGREEQILPVHLSEALAYREGANMPWTG
jgi:predicted ATPase with chaperone activity